jgi:hypothetical protein
MKTLVSATAMRVNSHDAAAHTVAVVDVPAGASNP